MSERASLAELKAKSELVLKGVLSNTRMAAAAAMLVPLGSIGAGDVQAMSASHIDANAPVQNTPGVYSYTFTVYNDSVSYGYGEAFLSDNIEEIADPPGPGIHLVDWELPLFEPITDLNNTFVRNIGLPENWDVELVEYDVEEMDSTTAEAYEYYNWENSYDPNEDPFHGVNYDGNDFLTPTKILHFFSTFDEFGNPHNPILEGDPNGLVFTFDSDYAGTNSPYIASFFFVPPAIGDPPSPLAGAPLTPNHPNFVAPPVDGVPEPATAGLAAMGILATLTGLKRRR